MLFILFPLLLLALAVSLLASRERPGPLWRGLIIPFAIGTGAFLIQVPLDFLAPKTITTALVFLFALELAASGHLARHRPLFGPFVLFVFLALIAHELLLGILSQTVSTSTLSAGAELRRVTLMLLTSAKLWGAVAADAAGFALGLGAGSWWQRRRPVKRSANRERASP
ncbi:MAG: hypothetical protein AAGD01_07940 [Acidobacteriota bacterium]